MRELAKRFSIFFLALLLAAASCTDEVQDVYARTRAFFRFAGVESVHPLYTACHNPGQWCTVTLRNSIYSFAAPDGNTATANATAIDQYGRPEWVAGLIVGRPSVPDMNGQTPVMAFDMVCPTCYEESAIQRSVAFAGNESVTCPRCSRTYDLTSGGIVTAGPEGKKLYRYRITADGTGGTLVVQN